MKTLITLLAFGALTATSFADEEITIQAKEFTCYQVSNDAVLRALEHTEKEAKTHCLRPELLKLQTDIKAGSCGFVEIAATYGCPSLEE